MRIHDDRPRILWINPGPVPPASDAKRNGVAHLSPYLEGTLLMPTWGAPMDSVQIDIIKNERLGGFGYWPVGVVGSGSVMGSVRRLSRYIGAGLAVSSSGSRRQVYDLVFTYGALTTGMAGWVLSRRMGVPLILEFPGHPFRPVLFGEGNHRKLKAWVAKQIARALVSAAHHVKLLYPTQLEDLSVRDLPSHSVAHDFVPVSLVPYDPSADDPEILLIGFPWFLKGVDIAIQAFLEITEKHPDVRFRVVGHCPDRSPFEALRNGNDKIIFQKPVPSEEAHRLISRCRVYLSASRTEGTARVLLEAGAAGRAVVASNVDGTPYLIQDGVNGLLFESENVADLAAKLDRVLSDAALRRTLGENGRRIVMEKYSEAAYARSMVTMFYQVLGRTPPEDLPGAPPV